MNVFISHASADQKWAEALSTRLKEMGIRAWAASLDVEPGANWHLEIGKALGRADAMVILISPEALASASVQAEIAYALSAPQFRDRLIPVIVKATDDVPWILQRQNMVAATKNIAATAERIATALGKVPLAA